MIYDAFHLVFLMLFRLIGAVVVCLYQRHGNAFVYIYKVRPDRLCFCTHFNWNHTWFVWCKKSNILTLYVIRYRWGCGVWTRWVNFSEQNCGKNRVLIDLWFSTEQKKPFQSIPFRNGWNIRFNFQFSCIRRFPPFCICIMYIFNWLNAASDSKFHFRSAKKQGYTYILFELCASSIYRGQL